MKTMDSSSLKKASENLQEKRKQKRELCEKLFQYAVSDFQVMVEHIKSHYPGVKIYQWGSLLTPEHFDELSDIDIAVEGITSPGVFFKLYKELDDMTEFSLDLVELDKMDSISRNSILERGMKIHNG